MNRLPTPLGILLLSAVALLGYMYLNADNSEAFDCCPPPHRPSLVPRYPPGANVTVFIDTTGANTPSGFSDNEMQAIENGIEDWNDEPNNSGVTFTVVKTSTPPSQPTSQNPATAHMAAVRYVNVSNPKAIAETQTTSQGQYVFNNMTFYQNIRSGDPATRSCFLEDVAAHETGHAWVLPTQMIVHREAR
jgi:hypothetical protein